MRELGTHDQQRALHEEFQVHQQHVIDWWKSRGYRVTVLSDWSLMCISEFALATADPEALTDAIRRQHAARWNRRLQKGRNAMRLRVEQTRNGRWIVMELQASGKWMPTHYIYPTREEAEAFIASCK